MDFQGEPDDQNGRVRRPRKSVRTTASCCKKALEDYGHKVHPLSWLARPIRAGTSSNGKAQENGDGPTSDPALNQLIQRVQKQNAPQQAVRKRRAAHAWRRSPTRSILPSWHLPARISTPCGPAKGGSARQIDILALGRYFAHPGARRRFCERHGRSRWGHQGRAEIGRRGAGGGTDSACRGLAAGPPYRPCSELFLDLVGHGVHLALLLPNRQPAINTSLASVHSLRR